MREDGVHSPYLEHWRLLVSPSEGDFACYFRDDAGAAVGLLIRIGAFAICANAPADPNRPTQFLLAKQGVSGWAVSAATPGHPLQSSGQQSSGLSWPQLLDGLGLQAADPNLEGSAGSFAPSRRTMDFTT